MFDAAVRCEGIGKRFSRDEIVPYHGLRTKIHNLFRRAGRTAEGDGILWALRDVSFELPSGRILGVLGTNGSGKSVLLKILARVTKPTDGRSVVRGSVSSILNLGAMLNPELTGRENIYQTGTILRLRRETIARRFDEIVWFSGIESQLDSLVRGYSAGMQLRLAFAVMAHLESDVLLIDEALSFGDQEFRERCVERIRRMGRAGSTIVIVSHELDMLAGLCDLVLVLEHGRVSAFGSARRIIDTYRDSFHGGEARAGQLDR